MVLESSLRWKIAAYSWPALLVKTAYIYVLEKLPFHCEFVEEDEYLKCILMHNIER